MREEGGDGHSRAMRQASVSETGLSATAFLQDNGWT